MGAVEAGSILNEPPVITSPDAVNVPENTTAVTTVTITDPDLPAQMMVFTVIGGADAAKFQFLSGGQLAFKSAPDYELPGDANGDRVYVVEIRVEDGVGGFDTQTISVTVTPVNDHNPVFQSPSTVLVPEGTTPVTPLTATDADLPVQLVTFSIVGGADGDKFAVSPGGALSFVEPPAHDTPTDADGNNVYVVDVQASDGAGGLTTQTIKVIVQSSLPPTADFNRDSLINGDDLPVWTGAYGATIGPEPTPGDADGDHDSDGHDFLAWQRTLGTVVPPATASAAAMPPASEAMASDVLAASLAQTAATQRSHRQQVHLGANVVLGNETSTQASVRTSVDARISHDRPRRYDGFPDFIHWHVREVALAELTSSFAALRASGAADVHDANETGLAGNVSLEKLWRDEVLTLSLRR